MEERFLCVADPTGNFAGFLKAGESGLEFVSGTPGAERLLGTVATDVNADGVFARAESFTEGRIDVDFVAIGPDDPRYLDLAADAFQARGLVARVYPKPIADLWRRLYVLPLSQELRASIVGHLDTVPLSALDALRAHIDEAEADLDRLAHVTR